MDWPLYLQPTSRSRAAVARRAHNPKVGSSILPFATEGKIPQLSGIFAMYTVYVLYSNKYNKIYVGYTSDLKARLLSHNELGVKGWTIKFRPWEIIYNEEYDLKAEALKRERELKSSKGREWIRRLIVLKR